MKLRIKFDAPRAKVLLEEHLRRIDAMPEERRMTAVLDLFGKLAEECIDLVTVPEAPAA